MELNDASAVWHPALRSEDNGNLVAAETSDALIESASASCPPPIPTMQPADSSAIDTPSLDEPAPVQDAETPSACGELLIPTETPVESLEEASEVVPPVVEDNHDLKTFEPEPESRPEREQTMVEAASDPSQDHVAEFEVSQTREKSSEYVLNGEAAAAGPVQGLSVYNDDPWAIERQSEEPPTPINGHIGGTNHDFWGSPKSVDDGEGDFFDQLKTQTKPIFAPPEAESRFEEGMPLLDDNLETPIEQPANQESQLDTVFANDEDEDDGFFSTSRMPAPENGKEAKIPFHIKRKSTSQVLGTLDVSQTSPTSPLSPTAEEFDNILAAAASGSDNKAQEHEQEQVQEPKEEEDLAARWEAELSGDELPAAPAEEDLAARWEAALDDDDDLLLDDEATGDAKATQEQPSQTVNGYVPDATPPGLRSPFGTPQGSSRPKAQQTSYTPHQPSTSDLLQGVVPPANSAYAADYFNPQPQPPAPLGKAESFAERSKEGYKSPYDLPEDITRRRRPSQKPQHSSTTPKVIVSAISPAVGLYFPTQTSVPPVASSPKNFYEDLPLPPVRPRSRPASSGRYAQNFNAPAPPPVGQLPPPNDLSVQPQLQQPERLAPYANTLTPSGLGPPSVPSVASRYSPKPPSLQPGPKPAANPRYSPAPPQSTALPPQNRYVSQPPNIPGQGVALPFQPRTSSPLAYHEKVSYQSQEIPKQLPPSQPAPPEIPPPEQQSLTDTGVIYASPPRVHPVTAGVIGEDTQGDASTNYQQTSPPRNPYAPPSYVAEFSRRLSQSSTGPSAYAPSSDDSPLVPPRRSQTQSPTQQKLSQRLSVPPIDPLKRPASVHALLLRPRQLSLEFIPPTDGQELDPLERWKGAPIVKFGFGGAVVSCFAKHVPRYSAGQAAPKIKPSPGEVKILQLSDWTPSPESIVQHPGPLRTKSKKKDLIAWLSSKIAAFENEGVPEAIQSHLDSSARHEEKILLWKIVRVLVEHDGGLQSSPELQTSVRNVIFPHLQNAESDLTYGNNVQSFSMTQPDASSRPDSTESKSLGGIQNSLLLGDREKAVWTAADSRLWGHAMIIASTMEKSVWKQVVQEFVRREVRSTCGKAESLAALYEIFAGNIEESIDELVPPSARAGLQMVSKVDGQGSSRNALAGLESWRDTLGLVLSNRSPEDHQALLALGRLLLTYGRVEAAHICLIFSRASVFGGPDDPQGNIVLLGADHRSSSAALLDDDAILLTEAYEYATSVLAGSPAATLPHLLAFKLIHAQSLADRGRISEALQYCEAIAAVHKTSTKPSGYHHQRLFYGVDELSTRLRQTSGDGGSSWISKPSMERVSSSMWNRFSNFVAGDDSDAASTGSTKAGEPDIGPFAKIAGTPTVSRSPSVTDLYGPYPIPGPQPIPTSGPSRYQPSNQYAPNSPPDQGRGRSSLDSQRSASFGHSYGQRRGSQEYPPPAPDNSSYQGGPMYGSPSAGYQSTPPQTSCMSLAPVDEDMATQTYPETPSAPPQGLFANDSPYQPPVQNSFDHSLDNASAPDLHIGEGGGYMPPAINTGYEPPAASTDYEPPTANTGYEPPASTGYEPPSGSTGYEPPSASIDGPEMEVNEEGDEQLRHTSSDMQDDDDDLAARAAALKKAERERKDREAEEAFRKAAEADAQKPAPAKGGWWFSGWVRRGNKEADNISGGPIRAKLGEESSFYYDNELKKWVNKKDPNSATQARATPPPPKGLAPPSRSASGSTAPPPAPSLGGPNSRPPSSAGAPPPLSASPVPSSLGLPPPTLGRSVSTGAVSAGAMNSRPGSSSGPPPRPATSLSNASSIDDLLGAPQARKGNAARGRKKGRGYVDVMAK
ncbi:hypothetical protein AOCH_003160 [Aspergillus ochraceoroseus]|uniref:Protein transport protein sec16 n=1 Tax=Aspergillus ochraceoroseus TaxID=138278 RepID=A0A0F8WHA8_9EURO|nr:hypothetical protein AOCH_003160 [Aspergillus ochraceoroseus]